MVAGAHWDGMGWLPLDLKMNLLNFSSRVTGQVYFSGGSGGTDLLL